MKWMDGKQGVQKYGGSVFETKPRVNLQLHERGVLWGTKNLFSDLSEIPLGGHHAINKYTFYSLKGIPYREDAFSGIRVSLALQRKVRDRIRP